MESFGNLADGKLRLRIHAFLAMSRATVATDPTNISVIKLAAIHLGAPLATACQLMIERQPNTPQSIKQVTRAAHFANPKPLPSKIPQAIESPPKTAPEIRAVTAAAGFEAKPASPQMKRKIPYPINHLEFVMSEVCGCEWVGDLRFRW